MAEEVKVLVVVELLGRINRSRDSDGSGTITTASSSEYESGRGGTNNFNSQNRGDYRGRGINYRFSSSMNARFSIARGGGRGVSVDRRENVAGEICFNCQRPGHFAKECRLITCYNCKQNGQMTM